jgi:hypothetical protein
MDESTIRIKCQTCGERTIVSIIPGGNQVLACSQCGTRLIEFEPLRGFIYVLSHPCMPNLLKIGFTTRQVEERVAELSMATAVPGPFAIEGVFPSSDPEQHELAVHKMLAEVRVESKEFFKIDLEDAIRMVSATCGPASYLRTPRQTPKPVEAPPPPPPLPPIQPKRRGAPVDETKKLRQWQERMYRK